MSAQQYASTRQLALWDIATIEALRALKTLQSFSTRQTARLRHLECCTCVQAYKYWLQGQHPFLFIVNNDVLVPSGVLTKLMDGMREDGALL